MCSLGDKKGQRRGLCGHIMASFDLHKRKWGMMTVLRTDRVPFVMVLQIYRKRCYPPPLTSCARKKGVLVSPEDVTVVAAVDKEPVFHNTTPPPASTSTAQIQETGSSACVTSAQLKEILDQWSEQFAWFEALLSRGNVFSTPKALVPKIPSQSVVSFIAPSAWLTGPVEFPAEGEADVVVPKSKEKKKCRKSRKEDKDIKSRSSSPSAEKIRETKELSQIQPPAPAQATRGPGSVK